MDSQPGTEHVETLVIGGGQSGLAMGYHLSRLGLPYAIVDANDRIGDAWRKRWDSLRLFTPARLDGLPGMRFPGYHWAFPSKDEMADYLESYAHHFEIPVRTGVRVERLTRQNGRFVSTAGERRFEAENVVVAMSSWQRPRLPDFAEELDPQIRQLHVDEYRNPSQIAGGRVLVVGAGNSGAEMAKELARTPRSVALGAQYRPHPLPSGECGGAGPHADHRPDRLPPRAVDQDTDGEESPSQDGVDREPLLRVKPKDLTEAGVVRVPRVTGVHEGKPQLEDGREVDAASVIWCTGFDPGFSWLDLPTVDPQDPDHRGGLVEAEPGLFFLGLKFLYSVSSEQIHGVGRDAARIAEAIAARHRGASSAVPGNDRQDEVSRSLG
jgi:putative flavoprotein involved in K+ transport